nr:reverse transcriptase domain-containing protein [Tanacetum cinerariifolium]
MATIAIIPEQVLEGRSELLVNAPTPTFLNVNHYLSKASKEWPVFLNGVKEWSLSFTSTTALLKTIRLWHVLENAHEDDNGQILSSKRDQEPRNGTLGAEMASKPKTMQEAIEISTELMDKKIRTSLRAKQRAKGSLRINQETLGTNNNNTRTKGRTPDEFTPQHPVERRNMGDLDPYALNAIITTTVHVLLSATTATKLAILQVTVGVWQIPIMLTIRGALGGRNNAPARVYAVGRAGTDPNANVVTADGRIIRLNTIIRGCTLNLLNHPFNIDLMPVELGKRNPNHTWCNRGNATRLSIISCTKTEKYVKKAFSYLFGTYHNEGSGGQVREEAT